MHPHHRIHHWIHLPAQPDVLRPGLRQPGQQPDRPATGGDLPTGDAERGRRLCLDIHPVGGHWAVHDRVAVEYAVDRTRLHCYFLLVFSF